jgi:hypothetical protein
LNFNKLDVTYVGGRGEFLHDWFYYLESYSENFIYKTLTEFDVDSALVYDPFAGIGTTPVSLAKQGFSSVFSEINPAMSFVTNAKLKYLKLSSGDKNNINEDLKNFLTELKRSSFSKDLELENNYAEAFKDSIYFSKVNYEQILRISMGIESFRFKHKFSKTLVSVIASSILVKTSLLKRAGDLRFKTKKDLLKGVPEFNQMFIEKALSFIDYLNEEATNQIKQQKFTSKLIIDNAKKLHTINTDKFSGVITSPPYLNGTSYFRNTKLELWFLKYLKHTSQLQNFRKLAVTGGINNVQNFADGELQVLPEVKKVYNQLLKNNYDSRIPTMITSYFNDMDLVVKGIKLNIKKEGKVCIDIGDSIFNGIHVKTDKILENTLRNNGFKKVKNIKLRDRRSKNGSPLSQRLLVFEA